MFSLTFNIFTKDFIFASKFESFFISFFFPLGFFFSFCQSVFLFMLVVLVSFQFLCVVCRSISCYCFSPYECHLCTLWLCLWFLYVFFTVLHNVHIQRILLCVFSPFIFGHCFAISIFYFDFFLARPSHYCCAMLAPHTHIRFIFEDTYRSFNKIVFHSFCL